MNNIFGNMTTQGLEETGDRLGGGGPIESGVYTGKITLAYVRQSQASGSQATGVEIHVDFAGQNYRETFWVTNRNGENFYADKQDSTKKHPLPGFSMVNDFCLVTTGHELADQDIEEKTVKLFDFEAKKEVPQNVPVLKDLIGQQVTVAILKQTVDKQKKNDTGAYVNTGETRDENVADKVFHTDTGRTVTEIKEGLEEGVFLEKWKEKNTGKTRNKAKGAQGNSGAPGGAAGAPPAASSAQKPKTSLFG